jgi:nucleotide-binding universal stress UspA family protein
MWKDMLVFADGSENGVARALMAASLAATHDAWLEICVVTMLPAQARGRAGELIAELSEEVRTTAREDAGRAADAVRAAFPRLADRLFVWTAETESGEATETSASLAQAVDLVVLGQPIAEDLSRLDDLLLEGALLGSGRPCLMLPRWTAPRTFGRRVLAAWRGGREAARAVHDALPLLVAADSVCIFHAGEGEERKGDGPLALSRLTSHLVRHRVRVEEPKHDAKAGPDIGEAILRQAVAFDADLIVMGGYGHSRLREIVLGGATRTIVRSSPLPVLLSH